MEKLCGLVVCGSAGEARRRTREGGSCAWKAGRGSAPAATDRERVDSEGACQRDGGSVESVCRHRTRRVQKCWIIFMEDVQRGGEANGGEGRNEGAGDEGRGGEGGEDCEAGRDPGIAAEINLGAAEKFIRDDSGISLRSLLSFPPPPLTPRTTSSRRHQTKQRSFPRPHKLLPYQPSSSVSQPLPDISASLLHNHQDSRNVPPLPLNGSPAPNKPAAGRQPSLPSQHHLESIALSGYSHPQHVSINNYLDSRLGTPHSPLRNPSDLAAHHGLPQSFPKAPSLVPTRFAQQHHQLPQQHPDPVSDFFALCQNYSAMLNKAPENADGHAAYSAVDPVPPPISPKEAALAVFDVLQGSVYERSPLDEFLTGAFDDSPESDMLPTPSHSPMDFGADIFQGTPLTGMLDSFDDFPPTASDFDFNTVMGKQQHIPTHPSSFDTLLTMTPDTSIEPSFFNTPMTPDLHSFPTMAPQSMSGHVPTAPAPGKSASTRRKSQPTGTRKNVTPETLVPIDAPIQERKYLAPSATSRKEVPATFARKRARSQAFGDEEEEVPQGPSMSEEEAIKAKRLQNTLAARRSRKRKLEHQQLLEETIEAERSAKEQWRAHAMVLEALLRDKGYQPPPAPQI